MLSILNILLDFYNIMFDRSNIIVFKSYAID